MMGPRSHSQQIAEQTLVSLLRLFFFLFYLILSLRCYVQLLCQGQRWHSLLVDIYNLRTTVFLKFRFRIQWGEQVNFVVCLIKILENRESPFLPSGQGIMELNPIQTMGVFPAKLIFPVL